MAEPEDDRERCAEFVGDVRKKIFAQLADLFEETMISAAYPTHVDDDSHDEQ